ncbi:MAG TPA: HAMP domain-containing sensor histidine kinase [Phycisphaerae bacterium]|jgi:signal transduction histidine kinase
MAHSESPRRVSERNLRAAGVLGRFDAFLDSFGAVAFRRSRDASWRMEEIGVRISELCGHARDQLISQDSQGDSYNELMVCDPGMSLDVMIDKLLSARPFYGIYYALRQREGGQRWLHEIGRGILNVHGTLVGSEGFLLDASAWRESQCPPPAASRRSADELICAEVAHHLTNLLTAISGNLSMIVRGFKPSDPLCERVEDVRAAAKRASDLTRDLHSYAQAAQCRLHPLDVNALVRQMLPVLRAVLPAGTVVRTRLSGKLPGIAGDAGRLRQALTHLCANAAEAATDLPRVTIRTWMDACGVCLSVADKGVGIPGAIRDHIFDPFFSTKRRGRGMGLAIVERIVRAHGATVDVRSNREAGTECVIAFPIKGEASHRPARRPRIR